MVLAYSSHWAQLPFLFTENRKLPLSHPSSWANKMLAHSTTPLAVQSPIRHFQFHRVFPIFLGIERNLRVLAPLREAPYAASVPTPASSSKQALASSEAEVSQAQQSGMLTHSSSKATPRAQSEVPMQSQL